VHRGVGSYCSKREVPTSSVALQDAGNVLTSSYGTRNTTAMYGTNDYLSLGTSKYSVTESAEEEEKHVVHCMFSTL
jgi:hypothetical protein